MNGVVLRRIALVALAGALALGLTPLAVAYQYNSQTQVTSTSMSVQTGGEVQLTATVQPGCPPFEPCSPFTGTITWDDGDVGGTFLTPTCTYTVADNLSIGVCKTNYRASTLPGPVAIMASYSGNANYSSSSGGVTLQVLVTSTQSTGTTSSSTSTSTQGAPDYTQVLIYVGVAAAVVVVGFVVLRMRKSL